MTRICAIVFDFDGVIADTERLHLHAFQEAFAVRGWTLDEATYFDRYLGYDDRGLVAAYSRDRQIALDESAVRTLMDAKARAFGRQLSSTKMLFPGAKACIAGLAQRFSLGIASGALRGEIEAILHGADMLDLFPVIIGADDVTTSKPSPEPYLTAAARMGMAPDACLAVEDSQPGLQAAHAAGMRTIAVTTTSPRHALALADRIIGGLDELTLDLIASIGAAPAL